MGTVFLDEGVLGRRRPRPPGMADADLRYLVPGTVDRDRPPG
jgi:hypothetical protein